MMMIDLDDDGYDEDRWWWHDDNDDYDDGDWGSWITLMDDDDGLSG